LILEDKGKNKKPKSIRDNTLVARYGFLKWLKEAEEESSDSEVVFDVYEMKNIFIVDANFDVSKSNVYQQKINFIMKIKTKRWT
jgi:hypothetical protein